MMSASNFIPVAMVLLSWSPFLVAFLTGRVPSRCQVRRQQLLVWSTDGPVVPNVVGTFTYLFPINDTPLDRVAPALFSPVCVCCVSTPSEVVPWSRYLLLWCVRPVGDGGEGIIIIIAVIMTAGRCAVASHGCPLQTLCSAAPPAAPGSGAACHGHRVG